MHQFDKDILNFIKEGNLIGIRAGKDRDTFLKIWMVVVDNRVFARSWGLSHRSWFTTFIAEHYGSIKCGANIVPVKGLIPSDLDEMSEKLNKEYMRKYGDGETTALYAKEIIEPAHIAKTMEFVPIA